MKNESWFWRCSTPGWVSPEIKSRLRVLLLLLHDGAVVEEGGEEEEEVVVAVGLFVLLSDMMVG